MDNTIIESINANYCVFLVTLFFTAMNITFSNLSRFKIPFRRMFNVSEKQEISPFSYFISLVTTKNI